MSKLSCLTRRHFLGFSTALVTATLAACTPAAPTTVPTPTAVASTASPTRQSTTQIAATPTRAAAAPTAVATATPVALRPATVVYWSYRSRFVDLMREIINDFQKTAPHITINYEPIAAEYFDKVTASLAANTAPDIWETAPTFFFEYVERKQLASLSNYLKTDAQLKREDFIQPALDSWIVNGEWYGLPLDVVTLLLYYNVDMFNAAGVALPTTDWTWDDYRSAALKLTRRSGSDIEVWGTDPFTNAGWLCSFIAGNGGRVLNDKRSKCVMDQSREAVDTIQFFTDLVLADQSAPAPGTIQGNQPAFLISKVAMTFGLQPNVSLYRPAPFQWDCTLVPKSKTGPIQYGGPDGIVFTSTSKVLDAGWAFARFWVVERGEKFAINGGYLPALKKQVNAESFLNQPPPPRNIRLWPKSTESIHNLFTKNYGQWTAAFGRELVAGYQGQKNGQQVANDATKAINDIFVTSGIYAD